MNTKYSATRIDGGWAWFDETGEQVGVTTNWQTWFYAPEVVSTIYILNKRFGYRGIYL